MGLPSAGAGAELNRASDALADGGVVEGVWVVRSEVDTVYVQVCRALGAATNSAQGKSEIDGPGGQRPGFTELNH